MKLISCALFLILPYLLFGDPVVDGTVQPREYAHRVQLLDGNLTLFYTQGKDGGLFVAAQAKTTGWVGVGLGKNEIMSGATIFMGYIAGGAPVFSEQKGKGHSHEPTAQTWDREAVAQKDGVTTLEFHLPKANLPFQGNTTAFIVAYADAADLTTFHDDNHDSGTMTLP